MKKSITTADLYGGRKKKRPKILTTADLPLILPIQKGLVEEKPTKTETITTEESKKNEKEKE